MLAGFIILMIAACNAKKKEPEFPIYEAPVIELPDEDLDDLPEAGDSGI
tara:strand:- start:385 stop:531 length:147 start_codon:yes stop_codon:yes gene_type:complete